MKNFFTIREAAAIAGIPARSFRLMIEREGVGPEAEPEGAQRAGRLVSLRDMIFFKLLAEFPFSLEKAHKSDLEALVRGRRTAGRDWHVEGQELVLRTGALAIRVDTARVREMLARNAAAFLWGQRRIVSDPAVCSGELVFRGTCIALDRVESEIRNGASDGDLGRKFPELSQTDVDYARIHARLGNRPGRPRKPLQARNSAQAA